MGKEFITYSEAFKMQAVQELKQGKFASILQAQKAYGICGAATVQKWVKKYGIENLLPKQVRVETMAAVDGLKEAKKRIRDLEKALSDSHMDFCLERAFLEIACEQMGTCREELKKQRHTACGRAKMLAVEMKLQPNISALALKFGMSRQNYYKGPVARR